MAEQKHIAVERNRRRTMSERDTFTKIKKKRLYLYETKLEGYEDVYMEEDRGMVGAVGHEAENGSKDV